jgi:Neutral/alkaline non-lysosomal ceramidase, N-terminal
MRTLLACLLLIVPTTSLAGTVPVGVARVDVTPDHPIMLSGYSSRKAESNTAAGKLWVKALAIGSDADGPALVVTADNLGIPDVIGSEVASRLKAKAGIPREKIAFGASHTHSAPVLSGCAPNIFGRPFTKDEQAHVDAYTKTFTDALESAAIAALADRRPMNLAWGEGKVGFAMNRRLLKNAAWTGFGEVPDGSVDHALPMLRAVDAEGKVRAILTNYACHCTTLNPSANTVHGDWAGFAQGMLEADHPGAIAMTLIGCGADANPKGRDAAQVKNGTALDVAANHGHALASEVNRLLKTDLKPLNAPPTAKLARVPLPFDKIPTRAELEDLKVGGKTAYEKRNAEIQLAKIDRLGALPPAIDYPVQTWRFGDDLVIVFLAGEVVVDYALGIKGEFDPKRVWVVAYANDAPCYIPSERILREGGYEAEGAMLYYAWPSRLKTGVEEIIRSAVRAQMPESFKN